MLFNSIEFIIFYLLVFVIYWSIVDHKKQNLLLLISSYVFYGWWNWKFLSLIIVSSIIDFSVGRMIFKTNSDKKKRGWLLVSLCSNLGLLGFFKYYNFFAESFYDLVSIFGWRPNDMTLNIILPVGISFYTFQTLSYTIDIYKNKIKPTNNVVSFFTYIAFFPQLVAGPIERASSLLPQIEGKRSFSKDFFKEGIVQISVGFFRKIVIADSLGEYVDAVYGNIDIHNGTTIILATIFYAFQIYYDFSGYSDIAIGTAKLLGFQFNRNFNLPYFSRSLTEFWRRWHISLSSWLRDYLYIPLGGNRGGRIFTYRNLMLTMLLGGLWHGSSWNFVIWGGLHGLVLSIEKIIMTRDNYSNIKNKIGFLGHFTTLLIVLFAWIFFRSQSFDSALNAIRTIFSFSYGFPFIGDINVMVNSIFVLFIGIAFDFILYKRQINLEELGRNFNLSKITIFSSVTVILLILFYSSTNNFIYFQF
nr:MBOAT family O-acyltransferase [uncultured Carboxylicivirga sp.]